MTKALKDGVEILDADNVTINYETAQTNNIDANSFQQNLILSIIIMYAILKLFYSLRIKIRLLRFLKILIQTLKTHLVNHLHKIMQESIV